MTDELSDMENKINDILEENKTLKSRISSMENELGKIEEYEKTIKDLRDSNIRLIKNIPIEPTEKSRPTDVTKLSERDRYKFLKDLADKSIKDRISLEWL